MQLHREWGGQYRPTGAIHSQEQLLPQKSCTPEHFSSKLGHRKWTPLKEKLHSSFLLRLAWQPYLDSEKFTCSSGGEQEPPDQGQLQPITAAVCVDIVPVEHRHKRHGCSRAERLGHRSPGHRQQT
ncbi:Polycomb Group Protein Asxl2-Like [Manis pentadactyla]|nr:Polycomb Group Protein Asxl2-Like [Manis pentadactyla]